MNLIKIKRPDDYHVHLRQGNMLKLVISFTASIFGKAVIMGNTFPPIVTGRQVIDYKAKIKRFAKIYGRNEFEPIMSVMLVNGMTKEILREANIAGAKVLKLIPGGTSTGSDHGVALENLEKYYSILEAAQKLEMIFSGHWELLAENSVEIPEFEREKRAIPVFREIISRFPGLKIVGEHVTTREMIKEIKQAGSNVAATVTLHHLLLEYRDVFPEKKEMNPFFYCKPVAKGHSDRMALIETITNGDPKFFFGSDSAPHPISKKDLQLLKGVAPAAGIFTAPVAIPLLWQIFLDKCGLNENTRTKFENFVSCYGSRFYGLPLNEDVITINEIEWTVPHEHEGISIFKGGTKLSWKVSENGLR